MNKKQSYSFDTLPKQDLIGLLKDLRLYRSCRKISRVRASGLFHRKRDGILKNKIEHFGELSKQKSELLKAFSHHFFPVTEKDIEFVRNDDLGGGVRLFQGDDMIEISLKDFENKLLT